MDITTSEEYIALAQQQQSSQIIDTHSYQLNPNTRPLFDENVNNVDDDDDSNIFTLQNQRDLLAVYDMFENLSLSGYSSIADTTYTHFSLYQPSQHQPNVSFNKTVTLCYAQPPPTLTTPPEEDLDEDHVDFDALASKELEQQQQQLQQQQLQQQQLQQQQNQQEQQQQEQQLHQQPQQQQQRHSKIVEHVTLNNTPTSTVEQPQLRSPMALLYSTQHSSSNLRDSVTIRHQYGNDMTMNSPMDASHLYPQLPVFGEHNLTTYQFKSSPTSITDQHRDVTHITATIIAAISTSPIKTTTATTTSMAGETTKVTQVIKSSVQYETTAYARQQYLMDQLENEAAGMNNNDLEEFVVVHHHHIDPYTKKKPLLRDSNPHQHQLGYNIYQNPNSFSCGYDTYSVGEKDSSFFGWGSWAAEKTGLTLATLGLAAQTIFSASSTMFRKSLGWKQSNTHPVWQNYANNEEYHDWSNQANNIHQNASYYQDHELLASIDQFYSQNNQNAHHDDMRCQFNTGSPTNHQHIDQYTNDYGGYGQINDCIIAGGNTSPHIHQYQ